MLQSQISSNPGLLSPCRSEDAGWQSLLRICCKRGTISRESGEGDVQVAEVSDRGEWLRGVRID